MIPLVYDQINQWGKDDGFFLALLKKINVENIADLGCGTGRLTAHFAKSGYHITAVDPNEEAIEYAKSKQYPGEVTWIVGDSSNLQINAFDAVIMTANVAQSLSYRFKLETSDFGRISGIKTWWTFYF